MSHLQSVPITYRDYDDGDEAFIYSTWMNGLYHGSSRYQGLPKPEFFRVYQRAITDILDDPATKVMVAVLEEDPAVIIGYSIHNDSQLHWVYVKGAWRKLGIARAIVPFTENDSIQVTHLTNLGRSLMPKAWHFNPALKETHGNRKR